MVLSFSGRRWSGKIIEINSFCTLLLPMWTAASGKFYLSKGPGKSLESKKYSLHIAEVVYTWVQPSFTFREQFNFINFII